MIISEVELKLLANEVCESLLLKTEASRTTIRADIVSFGIDVDLALGEAVHEGVSKIANDGSIDQRSLETVKWLEVKRETLIQPKFNTAPAPPQALIDIYGVKAQMLGPVFVANVLVGWISVHSLEERLWKDKDVAVLEAYTDSVRIFLATLLDHLPT